MRRVLDEVFHLSPVVVLVTLVALVPFVGCDLGPGGSSPTGPQSRDPFIYESRDDDKETGDDAVRGPLEIDFGGDGRDDGPLASFRGQVTGTEYEILSMKSGEDATITFDITADGVPYQLLARSIFHGIRWTIYDPRGEIERYFSYSHQVQDNDIEVITEETADESMTIHRRVLWDGRVEERYEHSSAGERFWIRPSESQAPPGFHEEYRAWFPVDSELSWDNPNAVTCMEIYHNAGFVNLLDEVSVRLENSSCALSAQKIPKWYIAFCHAADLCTLTKCVLGGGPANALCAFCTGASAGCHAVMLLNALFGG